MEIKCNFCRARFLYPIDKLEYQFSYNIRGWLKEINSMASLSESGSPNDLFAFKLNYNTVDHSISNTVTPLYNGNISETYWKSGSDNFVRKYGYVYDNLNRLTDAIYQKPILGNPVIQQVTNSYNEEIAYDRNGNITSMYRNGYLDADGGPIYPIDNLEYQYSHNKLLKVIDHTNSLDGFRDGQHPDGVTMPDYGYDLNGNMTYDWNKGIDAIAYNHLNLPTRINFKVDQGEKFISYIYNALGQKVSKQVVHQSSTEQLNTLTEYLSGFQYVGGILQLFPTAEGYVSVTNGKDFDYVYNYTDHIGNVRLSYTMPKGSTVLSILEENHYYPFGMKHANYGDDKHDYVRNPDGTGYAVIDQVHKNKYQYKYNGKEFQDELSLNWYDYHARNYDPSIGRWMNIDPLAEVSRRWSPYNYCMNNPVYFIDPDGMASVGLSSNERAMFGMGPRPGTTKSTSEQQDDVAAASMERAVANGSKASGETDPPKKGTGTNSGSAEYAGADGLPNGNLLPPIQLEAVTVVQPKKDYLFRGYFEGVPSGEYGPSASNPDAISLSYNFGANTMFGSMNFNVGFALTGSDAAFFYGGSGDFGLSFDKIGFTNSTQLGLHYNYGGNEDVLVGLGGRSSGFSGAFGLGGAFSQSIEDNGLVATKGVRNYGLNLGLSFYGNKTTSITNSHKISELFKD